MNGFRTRTCIYEVSAVIEVNLPNGNHICLHCAHYGTGRLEALNGEKNNRRVYWGGNMCPVYMGELVVFVGAKWLHDGNYLRYWGCF